MLADDNIHVRKRAVKVILGIRSKSATIRPVRNFKVPTLLYDAEHYYEMIDWEAEVLTEPPLTYRLSDDEIREVATEPLTFPSYNSHTQSIERAIKNVTNASSRVSDIDGCRGLIRSQISSRRLHDKSDTKTDLVKMLN